jgi:hypothetical protein
VSKLGLMSHSGWPDFVRDPLSLPSNLCSSAVHMSPSFPSQGHSSFTIVSGNQGQLKKNMQDATRCQDPTPMFSVLTSDPNASPNDTELTSEEFLASASPHLPVGCPSHLPLLSFPNQMSPLAISFLPCEWLSSLLLPRFATAPPDSGSPPSSPWL